MVGIVNKVYSLISHIGPIPLNWSWVQGKLVRHECIEDPAQYSVAKTQYYHYSQKINKWNTAKVYFN